MEPTRPISIPILLSPKNECNFMIFMSYEFTHTMLAYTNLD
jgi:hypothetical protein